MRLKAVVRKRVPSTRRGVVSKPLRFLRPPPSETSPVWKVQATLSWETLSRVICVSGE